MLPPCIVTDTAPVAAKLGLDTELIELDSADKAELTLSYLNPAVTCTLLLACPPCAARQAMDVSDCHTVPSHAVQTAATAVTLDTPMLAP
jgi:uncharacterized lipoprotein YajG